MFLLANSNSSNYRLEDVQADDVYIHDKSTLLITFIDDK